MDLDDPAYTILEAKDFFGSVVSFVNEFSSGRINIHEAKDNEHFTNIVYYMLGFIDDHFDSQFVIESLHMDVLLKWVNMYKVDNGIISIWLEIVQKCLHNYGFQMDADIERAIVLFILDEVCIFSDKNIDCIDIQINAYNILLELLSHYAGSFDIPWLRNRCDYTEVQSIIFPRDSFQYTFLYPECLLCYFESGCDCLHDGQ